MRRDQRLQLTPPATASSRPLQREAAITLAAATVGLVVLWFLFIRMQLGRQFEDVVWEHRTVLAKRLRVGHDSALRLVDETTIAFGALVVLLIGVARRRLLLGIAVTVAVAGATVSSQVLKRWAITRPPTVGELARISANSFPSGHATICTALGLAVLVMIPRRWRRLATVLVALWVAVQCVGVLASGWHRPSDALAGMAVAVIWMAAAVWVIARLGRVVPDDTDHVQVAAERRLVVGALIVSLVALLVSAQIGGETIVSAGGVAYLASCAVIVLTGVGTVWWFWLMLHDWTLDARPAASPPVVPVTGVDGGSHPES